MARGRSGIEHLLRRAGFGASPADELCVTELAQVAAVTDRLLVTTQVLPSRSTTW